MLLDSCEPNYSQLLNNQNISADETEGITAAIGCRKVLTAIKAIYLNA